LIFNRVERRTTRKKSCISAQLDRGGSRLPGAAPAKTPRLAADDGACRKPVQRGEMGR